MSTVFKPEYPWSQWYSHGFLFTRPEERNRKHIKLIGKDKAIRTTYARYLYAVHLGQMIPDDLHVDHINNDPSDDRIENLQLLTASENTKKYNNHVIKLKQNSINNYIAEVNENCYGFNKLKYDPETNEVITECDYCGTIYKRESSRLKYKILKGQVKQYCSKECYKKSLKYTALDKVLLEKIKELWKEGHNYAYIASQLGVSNTLAKDYIDGFITKTHQVKIVDVEELDKYVREGHSYNNIEKILGLNHHVVDKFTSQPLKNFKVKYKVRRVIDEVTRNQINHLFNCGNSLYAIAKKLNIDEKTVKKYLGESIEKNTLPRPSNRISSTIINQINSFSSDYTDNYIAVKLNFSNVTVAKYRKNDFNTLSSRIMSVRQKIDDSLVTKINELSELGYSNSKIARELKISKEIVYRYRFNLILKEDDLEKLAETIRLSKQGIPLYKIRKIVSVGKPKISTFASQSKRTDVQEKLKEYKINQYSYYEIFKQVQEKPNSVCTDDIFDPLDVIHRYINYNNYQINALKTYQRPGGDFTIYSTIETDDDTIFIAITGTE